MYILSRSITFGKKAGIWSVLGISTGAVIHTLLAAFGLSVILAKSPVAFEIVKYLGVGYLFYLGINAILKSKGNEFVLSSGGQSSSKKIYLEGLLTNLLNPKVALFFLAFLPQFVDSTAGLGAIPFFFLGSTFITTGTIWCLILAVFSSYATDKFRMNPKISLLMNRLCGFVYLALGINLLRVRV